MKRILHNFLNLAHSAYVTESTLYFGPTIWVQIPSEIRNKKILVGFKREIKKWKPTDCPIVSLIIHISWLLILRIYLLKKILPVSSILGQLTFIYHHPYLWLYIFLSTCKEKMQLSHFQSFFLSRWGANAFSIKTKLIKNKSI